MTLAGLAVIVTLLVSAPLEDPALEDRAQALMREIRCVACENEPVSQSAAPIAEDMRARIRDLVSEGATDQEVRDWFEARYGAHALFRPPMRGIGGWLLWLAPVGLLIIGGGLAFSVAARKSASEIEAVAADQTPDTDP